MARGIVGMGIWDRVLVLSAGGVLGVNARYWLGVWIAHRTGPRFPWSTVAINATGSFAIGVAAVLLAHRWPHPLFRLFVVTGFLGGYTTFSAFAFESLSMWERGDRGLSMANAIGSVAVGLSAVALGVGLGRLIVGPSAESDPFAHHRGHVIERADDVGMPPETIAGDGVRGGPGLRGDRDDRHPFGRRSGPEPAAGLLEDDPA